MAEMFGKAIAHRGFSYLHVPLPCVTFDKTDKTYVRSDLEVRDLPEDHDPSDRMAAMAQAAKAEAPGLGLYYREERATLGHTMNDIAQRAYGAA